MRKATLMQYKTLLKKLDAAPEDHSLVYVHPNEVIEAILGEISIQLGDGTPEENIASLRTMEKMTQEGRMQYVEHRAKKPPQGFLPRDAFDPKMMCRVLLLDPVYFFQPFIKAQEPWHVNGS